MKILHIWKDDLNYAISKLRKLVLEYNYVSMDTEFPGVVARPNFLVNRENDDMEYQTLKSNVDLLNIIQLGFTFSDEEGLVPKTEGCWQFNFYFNIEQEMFAQDSIDLLLTSGVNFFNHRKKGIKIEEFANLLKISGLIKNNKIKWISFHSGYDFGYLIKILTQKILPPKKSEFLDLLKIFFPCSYDMKYLGVCSHNLHGGLNKIAESFNILRVGPVHQAGSDSLLTLNVFFKLKNTFFRGIINEKYKGILYGLGGTKRNSL